MASKGICSIADCGKPVLRKLLCSAHLHRLIRHGDPLGGGTAKGELERYYREVVLTYEGDACLPWPYHRNSNGYGVMRRTQLVSRVVCEAAHGAPSTPDLHAAHSCGKGHEGCVSKHHLSWKTRVQNEADKIVHGTRVPSRRTLAKIARTSSAQG